MCIRITYCGWDEFMEQAQRLYSEQIISEQALDPDHPSQNPSPAPPDSKPPFLSPPKAHLKKPTNQCCSFSCCVRQDGSCSGRDLICPHQGLRMLRRAGGATFGPERWFDVAAGKEEAGSSRERKRACIESRVPSPFRQAPPLPSTSYPLPFPPLNPISPPSTPPRG